MYEKFSLQNKDIGVYQYYKSEQRHLRSLTVSKRCILYIF